MRTERTMLGLLLGAATGVGLATENPFAALATVLILLFLDYSNNPELGLSLREERSAQLEHRGADGEHLAWEATAKAYAKQRPPGVEGVTDTEALWGEDAEAVEAAVEALFGHHPERGGVERAQAAYAVVAAVKPIHRKPDPRRG